MRTHRLFRIAPSLARLIRRDRGGEHVLEGYFPDHPHQHVRNVYVRIKENRSSLVLLGSSPEGGPEERTDLPLASAQALLAVTAGQVEYSRTSLTVGSRTVQLQCFTKPGPLDLVLVELQDEIQGEQPWPWLGPDVSAEPTYQRRRMALYGCPAAPELDLTDAALNSLLDLLENRFTTWPPQQHANVSDELMAEGVQSLDAPVPVPENDADQEADDLGIEDAVMRELARSLQPPRS